MTRIWRCHPRKYLKEAYQGLGGLHVDGRWHNVGRPVTYASTSPGTAVLEALVHDGDLPTLLETHVLIGAELPDAHIQTASDLPRHWNAIPFVEGTQVYGDEWLEAGESVGLKVPSSVVPDDNVILNPRHPDFAELVVDAKASRWDPRLVPG